MRTVKVVLFSFLPLTLLFSSCGSSRNAKDNFVPFTHELFLKLEKDNVDLRQVQFYIDQELILSRNMGDTKVEVNQGVVKLENGKYINEVVIPALTPGVCENAENEKLMVSFEKGNNSLAFGLGSGYSFNQYVLYGTEWKNGTAAVTFDAGKFRARCGGCSDVASVTLLIRKSERDRMERKYRVVKGRTVNTD